MLLASAAAGINLMTSDDAPARKINGENDGLGKSAVAQLEKSAFARGGFFVK